MTVNPQRIARLQEHGMTEYEARAYLALLELETSEASPIADLARVPRTKIYQALDGLEAKKLITVIPERPKRYSVQLISAYLDELENNFRARADAIGGKRDSLVEEFSPRGGVQVERAGGFVVLKGRANVSSKLVELIGKATGDVSIATTAMGAHRIAYHTDVVAQASARGANPRILAPLTAENREAFEALGEAGETRHAVVDLGRVTLAFADGKEVLLIHHIPDDRHYFQGSDVALWSDDPGIVASLRALFTLGWRLAETRGHAKGSAIADPALAALAQDLQREIQAITVHA